jgi:tetratricopeptide (TPR) repeat protein
MTHLLSKDDWQGVYDLYKNSDSSVLASLRIWSAVAIGKDTDALKFIDTLKSTNESWRNWTKGMVYAELGKNDKAKDFFETVSLDFMNLNDYLYLSAFYHNAGFSDAADALHNQFAERPAGLYMLNQTSDYAWKDYAGLKNALSFSLVQAVSHSASMARSDLALLLLRMAQSMAVGQTDAIDYYLGMYFYANDGDYKPHFSKIGKASLFYPFVMLKYAENTEKFSAKRKELRAAVKQNPLFVPAVAKLVAINVQHDRKNDALRVLDNALSQPNLSEIGRAFFLKSRAHVYLVFGDTSKAQRDIDEAAVTLPADAGVLSEQARIWTATDGNRDDAYAYALALVKRFPAEIEIWDTLGRAVYAKDGATAALAIYEKVGRVAESCSSLFENLGDIYAELGDPAHAKTAYTKAISLSEDGMTIETVLRKKIKALK